MRTYEARRAVSDIGSVCRSARPTTAARWLASLVGRSTECARRHSLSPADQVWARTGASFRTSNEARVSLPSAYTAGAREMYCRNVYLRHGLTMPTRGWVVDLGANHGLFSVWAALSGADVVAVEAQQGFASKIGQLAAHNRVADRVHVEIAIASGGASAGNRTGMVADDRVWSATSHGGPNRPAAKSVPQLMSAYRIDRIGLLKVDIEGGEFGLFAAAENLGWLGQVDQLVLEVHPDFGDVAALAGQLRRQGFAVSLHDNDDRPVAATCDRVTYAYCRRPRPRLGVVAFGPIQYHTPLFQLLTKRGNVALDVLFLSDNGLQLSLDPGFGLPVAWDIDLLSGYEHRFLSTMSEPVGRISRIRMLARWIALHDAIVVNGYNSPWMLLTMLLCRLRGVPYLLRASSHPRGLSGGFRRGPRHLAARAVVRASAGGLVMGQLNGDFYRRNHARFVSFAPNSVDNERFAAPPPVSRSALLERWGLPGGHPVILFSGKLIPRKRPLDLVAAVRLLKKEVTVIFVGDGSLADHVRRSLNPATGVVTGFVNQTMLPAYYHTADLLVLPSEAETWGMVVNEAMAAGALPVVSDRVGCAPDLASGVGEVFRCGDIPDLAAALSRALTRINDPGRRDEMRQHAALYGLDRTAAGFEQAALAVGNG